MNRPNLRVPLASLLALIATGAVLSATRLHAATTVALVSTCGGEAGQDVLALAETALSAEADIALVERRDVERVLQEQELMHCGQSEAEQAVAAGQLLGVQVFASLETVPDEKEALGLVVFDAATGVVLWDSVLSGTNVDEAAVEVDAAVEAGCEKRQRPAGSLTRLCILSVRNVDLPRQFDSSCQSIGNLLQRQLVQSPSLAVLERQHLENVNKERLLPAGVQTNQLLPSLVLIELDISRNGATNGLSGVAILSDTAGTKLGQATAVVESENPADLSDRLLLKLEKLLKATPSRIVVDRAREADRFAREAGFLLANSEELVDGRYPPDSLGLLADGLKAIEAANALMPTNMEFQEQLVKNIGLYAGQRINGGNPDQDTLNYSLDLGLRGLEICRSLHDQAIAQKGKVDGIEANIWLAPQHWLNGWYFWDRVLVVANKQDADTTRKIREFQQRCRELELNFVDRRTQAAVTNLGGFGGYTQTTDKLLRDLEKYTPSSSVWTADTLNCLRSWLKMAERFSLDGDSRLLTSTRMLARLCNQAKGPWGSKGPWTKMRVQPQWIPHIDNWDLQPDDYAQFDGLFREMEGHPDPVVVAYGLAGQLSSKVRDASSTSTEVEQQYQRAKEFIREQISTPRRGSPIQYRVLLYNAALDLIDLLPDPLTRQREYQELFEFMLSRKEIEYWVTRMVIDPHLHLYRHYNTTVGYGGTFDIFPDRPDLHTTEDVTRLLDNARRVRALLRSGESQDIDTAQWSNYNTGSFERELVWMQRDIKTDSGAGPSVPWEGSQCLFVDSGQSSDYRIASATVDSTAVYMICFNQLRTSTTLQVTRVPLDGGQPLHLGEASFVGWNYYGVPKVCIPAVGGGKLFVGTDRGIFVFPLDKGEAQHIGTTEGLPSEDILSLAYAEGKLYAGLDGGYLVSYDLRTNHSEILVSSRRHQARSALDDLSPPAVINFMIPDPERHRVLFTADLGINVRCVPQLGLWQLDTRTSEVQQLFQLYAGSLWAASMGDGMALVQFHRRGGLAKCDGTGCGVVSFELATNRIRLLAASDTKPAGPDLPAPEGTPRMPVSAYPPFVVVDGWLWFSEGAQTGRISTNGSTLEYFPVSKETRGPVPFEWKSFNLIGNRDRLVVTGGGGVWLLNLKMHETSADASKDSP